MIPKVIHYCWFGNAPLPKSAKKCIQSWKRFFPEYQIKEWNETNFDVNLIPYTREAYAAKKYAFVSDFARFWILYHHGGLYFDTDVEVIRNMNHIIEKGPFMGCEKKYTPNGSAIALGVAPGLGIGATPGMPFYQEIIDLYSSLHFILPDQSLNLKTVVEYTSEELSLLGLKNTPYIQQVHGIWIYPNEYFCPLNYQTNKLIITNNTCTIHHYKASWKSPREIFKYKLLRILGQRLTRFLVTIKRTIKNHAIGN